jgi:hypothetical protein
MFVYFDVIKVFDYFLGKIYVVVVVYLGAKREITDSNVFSDQMDLFPNERNFDLDKFRRNI